MKEMDEPSKIRILSLIMLLVLISVALLVYHRIYTFKTITVVMNENVAVEYGSANYDILEFIEKIEGEIVSIKKDIDTNLVGNQEVVVEVKKENIVKEVPLIIPVIDTTLPTIQLKEEEITITQGDEYNLLENVDFVKDEIDGDIPYQEENEANSFSYRFEYDENALGDIGEHEIKLSATDKNGNTTSSSFILKVVAPKKTYYRPIYTNLAANSNANDLVSIAYSLIGSPYIAGSNGPYGFDCSGFVQYVYSRVGISVSRSASTQIYDGLGVSYEDAKPGDIISWGYSNGAVTHSALYIGNGQMIHAANPSQGVILSDVYGWMRGSGTQILSIRRIA